MRSLRILVFILGLCIPVGAFALEPVNPVVRVGQEIAERALTCEASALSALGDLSLKSSMEAATFSLGTLSSGAVDMSATEMLPEALADTSMGVVPAEDFSPVTLGMQAGTIAGMEIPLVDDVVTENLLSSMPDLSDGISSQFLDQFGNMGKKAATFKNVFRASLPQEGFVASIKRGIEGVRVPRKLANSVWERKGSFPEEEFFFGEVIDGVSLGADFSSAQLKETRTFFYDFLSKEDLFSSSKNFAGALHAMLFVGFIGGGDLVDKTLEVAKQAPEGKRFLADFAAVRALLMQKRYDLLQGLMDFRLQQTGWEEVAPVYEELKLYTEKEQPLPLSFPDGLVAQSTFSFDQVHMSKEIADFLTFGSHMDVAMTNYDKTICIFGSGEIETEELPKDSADRLVGFLIRKKD